MSVRLLIWPVVASGLALGFSPPATQGPDGEALYQQNCSMCHGRRGSPTSLARATWSQIPALNEPGLLKSRSDDSVLTVMHRGIGKDMPPFNEKLTAEERLAVMRYARSLAPSAPPPPPPQRER